MDGQTFLGLSDKDVALFWNKVTIRRPEECWPWTGAVVARGYGLFDRRRGGKRKAYPAHRVAFILTNGPLPADKPMVLHNCDNPPCCNPTDLRAGTAAENSADMLARGRHWTMVRPECIPRGAAHWTARRGTDALPRGESHPMSKLTAVEVQEIRQRYLHGGTSQRALAAEYGVSQGLIWRIVTWQLWSR